MQKIYPFFLVHSGCVHRCQFCNQQVSSGYDSACLPEDVENALFDNDVKNISEVAFYGGSFTLLPQGVQRDYLSAVSMALDDGRVGGIRISTRPDAIDERALALLKEYGVTTVELGCQSFDNSVLNAVDRGHTGNDIVKATTLLQQYSFKVGLQFMVGLPEEDLRGAAHSIKLAADLSPDFIRLSPTLVLKGSALESRWRSGDYDPLSLDDATNFCADVLLFLYRKEINVARIGLHDTENMDGGVLAGPIHPAFGQLVKSVLWKRAIQNRAIQNRVGAEEVELCVAGSDLSDAVGHGRQNLIELKMRGVNVTISSDRSIQRGEFRVGANLFSMMKETNYEYPEFWK